MLKYQLAIHFKEEEIYWYGINQKLHAKRDALAISTSEYWQNICILNLWAFSKVAGQSSPLPAELIWTIHFCLYWMSLPPHIFSNAVMRIPLPLYFYSILLTASFIVFLYRIPVYYLCFEALFYTHLPIIELHRELHFFLN